MLQAVRSLHLLSVLSKKHSSLKPASFSILGRTNVNAVPAFLAGRSQKYVRTTQNVNWDLCSNILPVIRSQM